MIRPRLNTRGCMGLRGTGMYDVVQGNRWMSRVDERSIDFARLVHEVRVAAGMTQEQFARELGVTYGTVNAWENGKHRPMRVLARQLLRRAERQGIAATGQARAEN